MKFLMIDDSDYKILTIKQAIADKWELDIAKWYVQGMAKILTNHYDGLILDMQFPLECNNYHIERNGGFQVLDEMNRLFQLGKLKILIPTLIYSSGKFGKYAFSKYENVKGVISPDYYINDKLLEFIESCENKE